MKEKTLLILALLLSVTGLALMLVISSNMNIEISPHVWPGYWTGQYHRMNWTVLFDPAKWHGAFCDLLATWSEFYSGSAGWSVCRRGPCRTAKRTTAEENAIGPAGGKFEGSTVDRH